jgi:ABC-2 type transport system permease protein
MLRGASLQELSAELFILAGFIVVLMTLAILRFSKRLD